MRRCGLLYTFLMIMQGVDVCKISLTRGILCPFFDFLFGKKGSVCCYLDCFGIWEYNNSIKFNVLCVLDCCFLKRGF